MMTLRILPSALEDLAVGHDFYEAAEPGLGACFLEHLYSEIDSLRFYTGIHPIRFGLHRLVTRRFPFAIYYRVVSDSVEVAAVLDCRRRPGWIRNRLRR